MLTNRVVIPVLVGLSFVAAALRFSHKAVNADEWLPVSPEELKMTSEPKAPGAPAIILYRQIDRDDSDARTPHEYNYVREKIFTEEGRKYADVEIPFFKGSENVVGIRARTIRPDGSIVNFDYNLKVPGWVSGAGKRALLPVGLFSAPEKHVYEHATRVHPLYFQFMYQKADDVQIELPLGWQVSSLPQPVNQDAKLIVYNLKTDNKNGTLHLERHLAVDLITLEQKYYPTLRNFYQMVKNSDEQQIVLQPLAISSSN